MPVNLDFGNDMIAAYSRGSQEREEQVRRLQDAADKQVALKQHQQQIDQEHDHAKAMLALAVSNQKMAARKATQDSQAINTDTGGTPAGFTPIMIPNAQDPSKLDVQQYVSQDDPTQRFIPNDVNEIARRTSIGLGPKTEAQLRIEQVKAQDEAQKLAFQQQLKNNFEDYQQVNRMQLQGGIDQRTKDAAALKFKHDTFLHNLDNSAREKLKKIGGSGLGLTDENGDPADSNVARDIYINGVGANYPAKTRLAVAGVVPKGWTAPTKKDIEVVEGIPTIMALFDKAKGLADYSYDQGVGKYLETQGGTGEGAILRNELDGQLGSIARYFGQERGVLTERDTARAKKLFTGALLNKTENLKLNDDIKKDWFNKIATSLSKFPADQRAAILTSRGLDPREFGIKDEEAVTKEATPAKAGNKDPLNILGGK